MTRTEIDQDIDTKITNKTALDSITPAEDGANRKSMLDYIESIIPEALPYKSYIFNINQQADTNAPVVSVFENNVGDIVWSRNNTGQYLATLNGAFLENKVYIPSSNIAFWNSNGGNYRTMTFERISDNILSMSVRNESGLAADGIYLNLEIRVYN